MDLAACSQLQRYRPYATRHVIPLLPLFGDWKGTGRPVVTLVSRNGR